MKDFFLNVALASPLNTISYGDTVCTCLHRGEGDVIDEKNRYLILLSRQGKVVSLSLSYICLVRY